MDFHEILYIRTYWKSVKKLQISLKPDRNSGNCTWRPTYLWYHAKFFKEWEIFHTKVVVKTKTHKLCSITYFLKIVPFMRSCEKYGTARQATDDNIMLHRQHQFEHWITKARIPLQKTTPGIYIADRGNVYRWLTEAMVHPSQGLRHCADGCVTLGWWWQCHEQSPQGNRQQPIVLMFSVGANCYAPLSVDSCKRSLVNINS